MADRVRDVFGAISRVVCRGGLKAGDVGVGMFGSHEFVFPSLVVLFILDVVSNGRLR